MPWTVFWWKKNENKNSCSIILVMVTSQLVTVLHQFNINLSHTLWWWILLNWRTVKCCKLVLYIIMIILHQSDNCYNDHLSTFEIHCTLKSLSTETESASCSPNALCLVLDSYLHRQMYASSSIWQRSIVTLNNAII